jgi:hypothetical protein
MDKWLPLLNLLIVPLYFYLIKIEHRITKIETCLKLNCKDEEKR